MCFREGQMMKLIVITFAVVALSACGTAQKDRALSGAGIGAGVGVIGGPPGILVGSVIGAGVGAFTEPNKVNLGEPAWKQ
jgi:hypothetical protein